MNRSTRETEEEISRLSAQIGHFLSPEGDAQAIVKLEKLGANVAAEQAINRIRKRLTSASMRGKFERALARLREEEFAK